MMSPDDKRLLEINLPSLVTNISLEDGLLLAHLRVRRAISRRSEETIQSVENRPGQARRLLDILLKGDCDVIDKFVYSLRATGQGHVAKEYLRQPKQPDNWKHPVYTEVTEVAGLNSGNVLSETDIELLEKARPQMMEHLGLSNGRLLSQLRVRGVLEDFEEDLIKAEQGDSNGVGRLINLILQKSFDSMEDFLHALTQTGHYYLVKRYLRSPTTPDTFVQEQIITEEMPSIPSVVSMMSPEDQDMLEECRVSLITHIALEDGMLLAHLRARGAITARVEEDVKIVGDRPRQVERLLDTLLKGDCDSFDKFVYSLRAAEQAHVADEYLRSPRQPDSWNPAVNTAQTADADLLERVRPQLMRAISLKDNQLLEQLRGRGVLMQIDVDQIMGERGDSNRIALLINFILKTGPDSMEKFLHALKQTEHLHVVRTYLREPTTEDTFVPERSMKESELEDTLRYNLRKKIKEWRTALEEGIFDGDGQLSYIDQPCVETTTGYQQLDIHRAIQLVEDSSPGERIVISGAAGMGKTTLLKELARSWVDKKNSRLVDKFQFVFLMPMRLIGKSSLLGIICDELKLLPVGNIGDLQKSLEENERRVLFLLDSHEELRGDIKAKSAEIDGLITGKLFSKSTVIVTTRPGSKLRPSKLQRTAKLSDLPKEKVEEVVKQHLDEDENAVDEAVDVFPALSFLQKPINLAMFLFIVRRGMRGAFSYTPTELFSLVIQYIMLAYAKKKQLKEFAPKHGSPFKNRDIPRAIRRLLKDITSKCYEERKNNSEILHFEDAETLEEYLDFGLFTPGPEPGTAVLPHPLFQDYFAATYLAEDPKAWTALYGEIRERSARESSIPSLIDVAESFRLINVFEFLVALPVSSPVCEQISTLFVAKHQTVQSRPCECHRSLTSECHSDLVGNCIDETGKQAIARALLGEAVAGDVAESDTGKNISAVQLVNYCQVDAFLKTKYDFRLCLENGKALLSSSDANVSMTVRDKFLIALVYWLDCHINTDELGIHWEMGPRLGVPACMLSQKITTVRQLRLSHCDILQCHHNPGSVSDIDISATSHQLPQSSTNSLLERAELYMVQGLEHCDAITTHKCHLEMKESGDVAISTLKRGFPKLAELKLDSGPLATNFLLYDTDEEVSSWLWNVKLQNEGELRLAAKHEGSLQRLFHILNILAGRDDIFRLILSKCSLLNTRLEPDFDIVKRNYTLRHLELLDCVGEVNLGQLLEDCSQCLRLREITIDKCQLSPKAKYSSDTVIQNNTLGHLKINNCKGDVELSQLLDLCRHCLQLEKLIVAECELKVNAGTNGATVKENNALRELELYYCKGEIHLGQFLDVCIQCRQLQIIEMVHTTKLLFDEDLGVTYLPSLRQFRLPSTLIYRTNGEERRVGETSKLVRKLCPTAECLWWDW